jgi:branched-chain amino acid transport system permease protein
MNVFLEQIINGLTIGSFYALIALGYTMVYGVMKLINFAHGDFFALGSYLGYTLLISGSAIISNQLGLWGGLVVALIVAGIGLAFVGVLTERIAYRPLYSAGRLPAVVSALGVSIFIENAVMVGWGPRYLAYTSEIVPSSLLNIAGVQVSTLQVVILLLSFSLMGALYYMVQKTTFGAAIRASAFDRDTAALMGININKIIFFIFTLGPALGGMTGVMVGMYYRQISFTMGWNYGLKAFIASILGGIGNIPGAMFGGLILGVLEMLGAVYLSAAWKDVFVFLILILTLIFRPTGLFGETVAEKV